MAGSKVFIIDQNCDGLASKPDGTRLRSWEPATQGRLRREWRKAKMTEEDYTKAFSSADERYAQDPRAADRAGEAVDAKTGHDPRLN